MGWKTRLSAYCTKRHKNTANLITSRNINMKLARPVAENGNNRVATGQGKVREIQGQGKVREF